MTAPPIPTDAVSARYRSAAIDVGTRRLLMSRLAGSEQEADLSEPPNCDGYGRIRHFRRATDAGWGENPLPIDPACRRLGLPRSDMIRAQAFQNAVCNWRCWYCFVPFNLLAGDKRRSEWFTPDQLVELYASIPDRPQVIDLTGGQPDLVPEWVPWTMNALRAHGLDSSTFLWSDDNLSTDFFWRSLSEADRESVATYPNYARVCCFKGFDPQSFAFNTGASPELFGRQFDLMRRLVDLGIDVYAYVTFTAVEIGSIAEDMARFVDRLQGISKGLPLRTVPLKIQVFGPVAPRVRDEHKAGSSLFGVGSEARAVGACA